MLAVVFAGIGVGGGVDLQAILTSAIHCSRAFGLPRGSSRMEVSGLVPFQVTSQIRLLLSGCSSTSLACQLVLSAAVVSIMSLKDSNSKLF